MGFGGRMVAISLSRIGGWSLLIQRSTSMPQDNVRGWLFHPQEVQICVMLLWRGLPVVIHTAVCYLKARTYTVSQEWWAQRGEASWVRSGGVSGLGWGFVFTRGTGWISL